MLSGGGERAVGWLRCRGCGGREGRALEVRACVMKSLRGGTLWAQGGEIRATRERRLGNPSQAGPDHGQVCPRISRVRV